MMGGEITAGTVVRLKSGGPSMTVHSIMDSDNVRVLWVDDEGVSR